MNNDMSRDQIALDAATAILPMYFESIPGWQLKAKIQCAVRDAIDLAAPSSGESADEACDEACIYHCTENGTQPARCVAGCTHSFQNWEGPAGERACEKCGAVEPSPAPAAHSSAPSEAEHWSKGHDDDNGGESGDALPCAGITIDDHGNAIEFYANSLELAQTRRDRVLAALARENLSAAIMALPCELPGPHGSLSERDSYCQGHRDAKIAAAALAAPAPTGESLSAALGKMRAAFHINMMRAFPEKSHAEIAAEIDSACGESLPGQGVPESKGGA